MKEEIEKQQETYGELRRNIQENKEEMLQTIKQMEQKKQVCHYPFTRIQLNTSI